MWILKTTFALLGWITFACAASQASEIKPFYYGQNTTEAWMSFENSVEFQSDKEPDSQLVMKKIVDQLQHMYGSMTAASRRAGPKDDYETFDYKTEPKPGSPGTYVTSYSFHGTIVLEEGPAIETYDVLLPINPDIFYKQASPGGFNYCMDSSHNEAQFYYYWNPYRAGCVLREGLHYKRIHAKISTFPKTRLTYPEYERLIDSTGTLRISLMMGLYDEGNPWDPLTSWDVNAANFRMVRQGLLNLGYSARRLSRSEIEKTIGTIPAAEPTPFVEELTKNTAKGKVLVRMFFGPTSIDGGNSRSFHYLLKDTMENFAVMVYGGHSGYGANWDLNAIEKKYSFKIQPNLKQYQIYFFNSCSSYSAYNLSFFRRKTTTSDPKGTKNLDILANGLVTYFSAIGQGNLTFLEFIDSWATGQRRPSYQDIVHGIDSDNLVGINGDEDNPTQ